MIPWILPLLGLSACNNSESQDSEVALDLVNPACTSGEDTAENDTADPDIITDTIKPLSINALDLSGLNKAGPTKQVTDLEAVFIDIAQRDGDYYLEWSDFDSAQDSSILTQITGETSITSTNFLSLSRQALTEDLIFNTLDDTQENKEKFFQSYIKLTTPSFSLQQTTQLIQSLNEMSSQPYFTNATPIVQRLIQRTLIRLYDAVAVCQSSSDEILQTVSSRLKFVIGKIVSGEIRIERLSEDSPSLGAFIRTQDPRGFNPIRMSDFEEDNSLNYLNTLIHESLHAYQYFSDSPVYDSRSFREREANIYSRVFSIQRNGHEFIAGDRASLKSAIEKSVLRNAGYSQNKKTLSVSISTDKHKRVAYFYYTIREMVIGQFLDLHHKKYALQAAIAYHNCSPNEFEALSEKTEQGWIFFSNGEEIKSVTAEIYNRWRKISKGVSKDVSGKQLSDLYAEESKLALLEAERYRNFVGSRYHVNLYKSHFWTVLSLAAVDPDGAVDALLYIEKNIRSFLTENGVFKDFNRP